MSTSKDSVSRTIRITLTLCIICSLVVSVAAVSLKERQDANRENEKKINVLQVAGLIQVGQKVTLDEVNRLFEKIKISIVDLKSGERLDEDASKFNQVRASKDPKASTLLSGDEDIAGIKRRENKGLIYEVVENGDVKTMVIPVRGYGLWSTLYGFLALDSDGNTVKGITFYQHAETPGLGGEVDNPKWKASWSGKKVYDASHKVAIRVVKGGASPSDVSGIDGLSGATLTSRGVEDLINYWLGDEGYGNFLKNF